VRRKKGEESEQKTKRNKLGPGNEEEEVVDYY
jgi:hypothetical protein